MITEVTAKSILRKQKKVDSWFLSGYGMNLYRGCVHDCAYCDGRAEGYYVDGEFGADIAVKVNAVDLLRRELDPARKRTPFRASYMILGGGVGDCYQPAEERYCLARRALELLLERRWPVHVLTKSTLVQRDMDLLAAINRERRAIISVSFSTVNDAVAGRFEPGVPPPSERLKMLARFREAGIHTGMYLMPVIPFVTDSPAMIDAALAEARRVGVDFVVFGGMTLKEGRQHDHFMRVLQGCCPERVHEYSIIYRGDKWGMAVGEYYQAVNQVFASLIRRHAIAPRMPQHLYDDILAENDRVAVMLEHIDALMRMWGNSSPYGCAARTIAQVAEPLSNMRFTIPSIKGVGPRIHRTVLEILDTGRSSLLDSLMAGKSFAGDA